MNDTVYAQIMEVRSSGESNMFDVKAVFEIAVREGYSELADFIFTDTKGYTEFILHGNREKDGGTENVE